MSERLLKALSKYHAIPLADQPVISGSFETRSVRSGEWLVKAGTVAKHLYFIESGILKVTIPHPSNKDLIYDFREDGQLMTFLYSMYGNIPAQQGLRAACNSTVSWISYRELLDLYGTFPYLKAYIDEIAQLAMAEMVNERNLYLTGDALSKYTLFLARHQNIVNRVALADIASYLGITPQSLSRIRRKYISS